MVSGPCSFPGGVPQSSLEPGGYLRSVVGDAPVRPVSRTYPKQDRGCTEQGIPSDKTGIPVEKKRGYPSPGQVRGTPRTGYTAGGTPLVVKHEDFLFLKFISVFLITKNSKTRMLGFPFQMVGSTDMGNVTFAVPAIHPMYKIGDGQAVNHTRPFTAVAG